MAAMISAARAIPAMMRRFMSVVLRLWQLFGSQDAARIGDKARDQQVGGGGIQLAHLHHAAHRCAAGAQDQRLAPQGDGAGARLGQREIGSRAAIRPVAVCIECFIAPS